MAAEKEPVSWKEAIQKNDEVDAQIAETELSLAKMEAELETAEARVEAAEARYLRVRKKLAREEAEASTGAAAPAPAPTEESAKVAEPSDETILVDEEVKMAPTQKVSKETKNASARTDKEVSRDKWVAARAAENRVKERTTKARERLRRLARDRKFDLAKPEMSSEAEVTGTAPAPAKEPEKQETEVDATKLQEGAKSIAERLKCLNDRPNAAEKRSAFMRVVTAGRENFYNFEPPQVVQDLQEQKLVTPELAADLLSLLEEAPAAKPASVPAEGWLESAKVASTFERLDDKPFKDAELLYLRSVEEKDLASAGAELEAAEAQLGTLVSQAEACFSELLRDDAEHPAPAVLATEPEVDEDEAERLEAQCDPVRESRGSKNTSALPPKVVSKERWLAARGEESRAREDERKVRDARRTEARDRKAGAADVPDTED